MSEDLTRAQFFKKALGLAGRYVSEVVEGKLEKIMPSGPTPPWALDTGSFLTTCEKCGACGEICPKGVIYYHKNANKVFGGTPFLDFQSSYCNYCGECVKVCPSGALNFERGIKELGVAKLRGDLCLVASEQCSENCVGSCPESAISIDLQNPGTFPSVYSEGCNGCGACVAACKSSAIIVTNS